VDGQRPRESRNGRPSPRQGRPGAPGGRLLLPAASLHPEPFDELMVLSRAEALTPGGPVETLATKPLFDLPVRLPAPPGR